MFKRVASFNSKVWNWGVKQRHLWGLNYNHGFPNSDNTYLCIRIHIWKRPSSSEKKIWLFLSRKQKKGLTPFSSYPHNLSTVETQRKIHLLKSRDKDIVFQIDIQEIYLDPNVFKVVHEIMQFKVLFRDGIYLTTTKEW